MSKKSTRQSSRKIDPRRASRSGPLGLQVIFAALREQDVAAAAPSLMSADYSGTPSRILQAVRERRSIESVLEQLTNETFFGRMGRTARK